MFVYYNLCKPYASPANNVVFDANIILSSE